MEAAVILVTLTLIAIGIVLFWNKALLKKIESFKEERTFLEYQIEQYKKKEKQRFNESLPEFSKILGKIIRLRGTVTKMTVNEKENTLTIAIFDSDIDVEYTVTISVEDSFNFFKIQFNS